MSLSFWSRDRGLHRMSGGSNSSRARDDAEKYYYQ